MATDSETSITENDLLLSTTDSEIISVSALAETPTDTSIEDETATVAEATLTSEELASDSEDSVMTLVDETIVVEETMNTSVEIIETTTDDNTDGSTVEIAVDDSTDSPATEADEELLAADGTIIEVDQIGETLVMEEPVSEASTPSVGAEELGSSEDGVDSSGVRPTDDTTSAETDSTTPIVNEEGVATELPESLADSDSTTSVIDESVTTTVVDDSATTSVVDDSSTPGEATVTAVEDSDTDATVAEGQTYFDTVDEIDHVDGSSGTDVFIINDSASNWDWSLAQDGIGMVTWFGDDYSVLHDVEMLQFTDATVTFDGSNFVYNNPNGPISVNDTAGEIERLRGTTAEADVFIVEGNINDYGYGWAEDGEGIVIWNGATGEYNVLHHFEYVQFNDASVSFLNGEIVTTSTEDDSSTDDSSTDDSSTDDSSTDDSSTDDSSTDDSSTDDSSTDDSSTDDSSTDDSSTDDSSTDDSSTDDSTSDITSIGGTSAADILVGTEGDDIFTGLEGADTFVASTGTDIITDMLFAEGDTLDLSSLLGGATTADEANAQVMIDQEGADGYMVINNTSIVVLEGVDLSSYTNISDMYDAGFVSY